MNSLIFTLKNKIQDTLDKEFKGVIADVAVCMQQEHGHYQCNNSLKLAKVLKKNPQILAQEIISSIDKNLDSGLLFIEKAEIAGPGFINFFLSQDFLSQQLQKMLVESNLGIEKSKTPKKIIFDFSSPNIAKELHVGHLRSTIIGDCLANLFEFLGENVLRLNHVGDWGTQFGMLIAYIKRFEMAKFEKKEQIETALLMQWYKDSKKLFDADKDFKKQATQEVVKLQKKDPDSLKIWHFICGISRKSFQQIYDLLHVQITERGESFYSPYLELLIRDLEEKDLVKDSSGAKCVYPEGFKNKEGEPLPLMVQKSDGGFNYDTTDLAALRYRIKEEKADRIIIVTDGGQKLHFQLVFEVAKMAQYWNPEKTELDHVCFGLVLGSDGKKFKTREGKTEKLIDLLQEGIGKAEQLLEEKMEDISEVERKDLAKILAIAAIKYADLSCLRTKDYVFSYEKMLRFDGNTAIFLLYSFVRIEGIKRKTNKNPSLISSKIELTHPSEVSLGFHLLRFQEVLLSVTQDLLPNRITDYLYELASRFNIFFRDCRVIGGEEEDSRLLICEITSRVLKQGLAILGIQTVERM